MRRISISHCTNGFMWQNTPRTFLDAAEPSHNGPFLLGVVKRTGGRGGEGVRKGREKVGAEGDKSSERGR